MEGDEAFAFIRPGKDTFELTEAMLQNVEQELSELADTDTPAGGGRLAARASPKYSSSSALRNIDTMDPLLNFLPRLSAGALHANTDTLDSKLKILWSLDPESWRRHLAILGGAKLVEVLKRTSYDEAGLNAEHVGYNDKIRTEAEEKTAQKLPEVVSSLRPGGRNLGLRTSRKPVSHGNVERARQFVAVLVEALARKAGTLHPQETVTGMAALARLTKKGLFSTAGLHPLLGDASSKEKAKLRLNTPRFFDSEELVELASDLLGNAVGAYF